MRRSCEDCLHLNSMTERHNQSTDNELRKHMTMKLFNFYLDDLTKLKVIQKLKANGIETEKGAIASVIRVLLNYFANLPDGDVLSDYIIEGVTLEYTFTTKKNKRSSL